MASTTGIEIGSNSCTLVDVRLASDRTAVVRALHQIGPGEWPASEGARVELLRSIRRSARLPAHAVVVAWESPNPGGRARARSQWQFLEDAGFQIRSVLSPAEALAHIAQRRQRFASEEATVWAALNVDAVAMAIVRGAEALYVRTFQWTYTPGLTQSRAVLLQRYSLVAHLAPQIRHGIDAVRASHDVSIDRVVTCGNLPDLRSLTMPLIEELDLEVETLDSIEGLRAAGGVTADRLIEAAPAIRLASAAATIATASTVRSGRDRAPLDHDEPSMLLRGAAALALIVAVSWGAFSWRQAMAPARVRPVVVPYRNTLPRTAQTSLPPVTFPSSTVRSDAKDRSLAGGVSRSGDAKPNGTSDEPSESTPVSTVLSVQAAPPGANRGAGKTTSAAEKAAAASKVVAGTPAPPSAARPSAPSTEAPVDRVRLVPMKEELPGVDSILIDQERRLAVIDGSVVGVGDRVAGRVIVQIDPEAVTLREPSGLLVRASVRSRLRN
jgi:hypothetical protein